MNDIDTEAKLISWLPKYIAARDAETLARAEKEGMALAFKAWLEEHDGPLYDGERGLQAFLASRRGTPPYDLLTIYERDPGLFERLLKLGCLQVNVAAVKAQGAQVASIAKYAGPAPETKALQVKEI